MSVLAFRSVLALKLLSQFQDLVSDLLLLCSPLLEGTSYLPGEWKLAEMLFRDLDVLNSRR